MNTNAPLYEVLEPDFRIDDDKEQWNSYESVFVLDFDEDGNLSVDVKRMEQFLRIHSSKVFYRQTDTMKYAHMRWTMIRPLSR